MSSPANVQIALQSEGVAVLIDVSTGRLPSIVHWGGEVGELTSEGFSALTLANVPPGASNIIDEPSTIAVLPEHWRGWSGRPGISGSRAGRSWSPKFTSTAVTVDGQPVDSDATQTPTLVSRATGLVEIRAVDEVAELELTVRIELLAGGVLRSQAVLTNTADEVYTLNDLVLAYPIPQHAREILDFAGRWGKERTPQRRELGVGIHLREGRRGRTGADAATIVHVGTPGFSFSEGEIWGVHTGWSGNHTHYTERLANGDQVLGGGELLLAGELPLTAEESYTSPWIYGSYGVGLDAVARRFHRYLRSRPAHPDTHRPVTLNVWEAVYFDHDLERLVDLAERAAALGVERYVLDDGWFGSRRNDQSGLGDWTVSPDMWPNGLHPLIDKVNELGMEFGLWFEPEMINPDSDVARAHPEWIMATGDRMPVVSRHQQVINLGIPECYAFIRDAIFAILAEYEIGYIKWDHNRDLVDSGNAMAGGVPGVHEQTLAFYRLVDEIKAAHPGLEIESCSSGGARVDLGVLERTERVWVSDCIDPLERQQMNRWTTQLIPPEMMGSHIASGRSHTTGRVHDLSFRAGSAVFGHLGIEWDLANATEAELDELGEWIAFYKAERDLLLRGDLVRLDFVDQTLYGHGVVAPDRSRAIYSLAAMARSEVVSLGRFRLPGLDPDRQYQVTPVLVGSAPSGLRPPLWWRLELPSDHVSLYGHPMSFSLSKAKAPGVTASGAALATAGLMTPGLDPDQVILFRADALD